MFTKFCLVLFKQEMRFVDQHTGLSCDSHVDINMYKTVSFVGLHLQPFSVSSLCYLFVVAY